MYNVTCAYINLPHVFEKGMRVLILRGEIMSERIIMDEAAIQRTVTRMAHEILEYNKGTENLVLLGIKTRGEFLAIRIQDKINQIEQK